MLVDTSGMAGLCDGMAIGMAGLCDKCDSLVVMETESRLANSAKLSLT